MSKLSVQDEAKARLNHRYRLALLALIAFLALLVLAAWLAYLSLPIPACLSGGAALLALYKLFYDLGKP